MSSSTYTPTTYRDAAMVASKDDPYPYLTGMASFAIKYTRSLNESENSHADTIRKVADEWIFTEAYVSAVISGDIKRRTNARGPEWERWTNDEADEAGRDYQRAMHDLIPPVTDGAPF